MLIARRKVCNHVLPEFSQSRRVWRGCGGGGRWGPPRPGLESAAWTLPVLYLSPVSRAHLVQHCLACVCAFPWFIIFSVSLRMECAWGNSSVLPSSDGSCLRAGLCPLSSPLRLRPGDESFPLGCEFPEQMESWGKLRTLVSEEWTDTQLSLPEIHRLSLVASWLLFQVERRRLEYSCDKTELVSCIL